MGLEARVFSNNIRRSHIELIVSLYKSLLKGGSFVFKDFTDNYKIIELSRFLGSGANHVGTESVHKTKVREAYSKILHSTRKELKSNNIKR